MTTWSPHVLALSLALLLAGACSPSDSDAEEPPLGSATTAATPLRVMAGWTGDEEAAFRQVLAGFTRETGVPVEFQGIEDDLPDILWARIEQGDPPDVAVLAQPGLLKDLASAGVLLSIEDAAGVTVDENFAPVWRDLGSVNGTLYGVFFKGANKSTVWYDVRAFQANGLDPPQTWEEWIVLSEKLVEAGVTPLAVGGADGWVLSDWFENVYLRTAGPEKYDMLARHEIPWTDASVKQALSILGELIGVDEFVARGRDGATETDFETSVQLVFSDTPEAAIVYEGDFVAGVILSETNAQPGIDFNFFDWPSIDGSPSAVMGGGDVAVVLTENPAALQLVNYLATPSAGQIWAALGGFSSPNRSLDPSVYPDEITRAYASALADAEVFRFDLSDLLPAELGATRNAGVWGRLQDWLNNPDDIDSITARLENEAQAAFGE